MDREVHIYFEGDGADENDDDMNDNNPDGR